MFFCARPPEWARVHQALLRVHARSGGSVADEPPKPLILNGWVFSSAREKHDRWAETVAWARSHGREDIVESVRPDEFERWEEDEPRWSPEMPEETSDG